MRMSSEMKRKGGTGRTIDSEPEILGRPEFCIRNAVVDDGGAGSCFDCECLGFVAMPEEKCSGRGQLTAALLREFWALHYLLDPFVFSLYRY